jgi:hypothetical protein
LKLYVGCEYTSKMKIIHWLMRYVDNKKYTIELIDDFEYDDIGPIIPDEGFAWVDIYGIEHEYDRTGVPALERHDEGTVHYYW